MAAAVFKHLGESRVCFPQPIRKAFLSAIDKERVTIESVAIAMRTVRHTDDASQYAY